MSCFRALTVLLAVICVSSRAKAMRIPYYPQGQPAQLSSVASQLDDSIVVDSDDAEDAYDPDAADAVKLLAEMYGRYLKNKPETKILARPEGFYPNNIPEIEDHIDLFRRDYGNDAIVTNNPEYVDMVRFVLTNRFRSQNIDPSPSNQPTYGKATASFAPSPEDAYRYYYGIPFDARIPLFQDRQNDLPLSLQSVVFGFPVLDGYHDAQIPTVQN